MSFEAAYGGERVIAQLHLPREKPPPYQVVVYSPAGSALFLRSSEHVGFPDFTFLVRSGRAVLLPVFKGTYERRFPRGAAGPNNFSEPTSDTSDAILAFDATSGAIVWSNQRTKDDLWNLRFPFSTEHPDFDFGDSAQVYTLSNGRKVVGAGQKSGFYHVLDAATAMRSLSPSSTCTAASSGVSSRTPPWPTA